MSRSSLLLLLTACAAEGVETSTDAVSSEPSHCVVQAYSSAAIQACVDSVAALGGTVTLPAGRYFLSDPIHVTGAYIHLRGEGIGTTTVYSNAENITLFEFENVAHGSISDMQLAAYNTRVTAIYARNLTDFAIYDLAIVGQFWTGIGLHGRDSVSVTNVFIKAERPVYLGRMDVASGTAADHFSFRNMNMVSTGNTVVEISDAAVIAELTFDGYQAWVGGRYGLYWSDGPSVAKSSRITINNLRHEQATGNGATIWINLNQYGHLNHFVCNDCTFAHNADGVHLVEVDRAVLRSPTYDGAAGYVFLDTSLPVTVTDAIVVER